MIDERSDGRLDFQAVLEQVPAIVFIVASGVSVPWLYVNEWVSPILGYTVEEWLATPNWARCLHPEDRERVLQSVRAFEAERLTEPYHNEYRLLHKDGHSIWVRENSKLVPDGSGAMLWYGVLQDISIQKATEAELERQSAAQAAVARLGEHALERLPIDQLLQEACEAAAGALDAESAMVARLLPGRNTVEVSVVHNWSSGPGTREAGIDPDTQVGATLSSGRPTVVDDWGSETHFHRSALLPSRGVRSSVCVPIEGPAEPWGCFGVLARRARSYSSRDVSIIQSLANVLADAIERQRIEDAIAHRALHDPLTTLPNRTLFNDRLTQAFERMRRRQHTLAAILFIDLDNFKQINDTFGHQAGDELLINVAQRLREAVRPTDTVARLSGDEFVVLLEEIVTERDAIIAAERIAAGFSRAFILEAGTHFVSASIGIALTDGRTSPQALLENADTAMYRAKEGGRARYELFDQGMRARAIARMRMENEISHALERGELRIAYQPLVDIASETLYAVEALLRWDHPQRGLIAPREFIPIAEESGLIEQIGQWVIEQALRDASHWLELAWAPPLRIGINVSIKQLENPHFPELLNERITASGVRPDRVHIEFSERALLDEAEVVRQTLHVLHAIGIELTVDDLGSGALSISHLAEVPLGSAKVDRTFVARLCMDSNESRVARALIALGTALSLRMIGEGAETPEQVRELRRLGCIGVQGNIFSAPLSASGIDALISSGGRLVRTLAQ